jgi:hypothetical protein
MGLTRPRAHQLLDIDYKQSVRVITVSNVSLSGGAPNSVDGVSLSVNDRILVTGQTTGSQNGLYYIATLGTGANGTWARSLDTNETGELSAGTIVMVTEGDTFKDTQWKLTTNDPITIGSTALVFEQNSAFAYGNIYANSTPVIAGSVGDTLTLTAGNNISITGNAAAKSVTIGVTGISLNSISNGTSNVNVVSSGGNVTVGVAGTSNVATFTTAGLVANSVAATNNGAGTNFKVGDDTWLGDINVADTLSIRGQQNAANAYIVFGNANNAQLGRAGSGPLTYGGAFSATGNITGGNLGTAGLVVATGNITGGNLVTAGLASVTGNVVGGNLTTAGLISATGNITGGNVTTAGLANVGTLTVNGGSTFTGNLLPSANITYDLGSPTQRWREIYLSGNTIDIGGATISADLVTGSLILKGPDGAEFILTGSDANDAQGAFGFLRAGNAQTSTSTTTGALTVAGGAGIVGNLHVGAIFKATGNVEGGNLTTVGLTSTGTLITSGDATIAGNLIVNGTTEYTNVTTLAIKDPIVGIGRGANNSPLTTNDNKDRGTHLWYYSGSQEKSAFIGWDDSASRLIAAANVTIIDEVVTSVNTFGAFEVGNLTSESINSTGNITGGNLITGGIISATGNIISVGNVSGNFMLGNGSQLSGINSFSSIAVTAGNTVSADSIADTLTLAAGSGITIVADSANDSITIALAQSGSNIFVNLADFGLVTEIVTASDDLGSVEDTALILTDLEFIVTSGVFYPTQLVLPPYTVMTLPSASPSGQMIYVTDESGGAVPAFSDGTDWRRVTDRAVIS